MKKTFSIFIFLLSINTYGQKIEDNKIIVSIIDTSKLYERTRQAIVNTNFIIREDSKMDTIITYSERIGTSTIYAIAKVIIKGNYIEITGAYGLGYVDFWGYPGWPKGYKQIIYFKESESWRLLRQIAIKFDSKITYLKDN